MDIQFNLLVIDESEASRKLIAAILNTIKNLKVKETGDFENGLELMEQAPPDITILNLFPYEENALNYAKLVTQKYPEIVLFVTSPKAIPDVIIQAMRVGARQFFKQPFNEDEIIEAVNSIIHAKKPKTEQKGSKGKVIAVYGAKGGVGTTTVATNIASALSHRQNNDVILVDLNLKLGNSALFFNVKPQYNILDVVNNLDKIDSQLLKRILPKHSSGVRILIGPTQIEDAESISAAQIEQTLSLLRDIFQFIIIDTNSVFDEVNIKALDEADKILTVSTLDIPSIYNTKRCLDLFQRMGYGNEKVLLILNRYSTPEEVNVDLIEKSLNYPIYWRIRNQSYSQMLRSINVGTPISMMMPDSKISTNFLEIAQSLNGGHDYLQSEFDNKTKVKFLQSIFKKRG